MPKRSSKKRKQEEDRDDPNVRAFEVVRQATESGEENESEDQPKDERPPEKNPAAVELGRLGGKKGGPARAKKLSPERRREIARKAARARWEKSKA